MFIEKGIRGGISMVSRRYAKANNPDIEGYDSEKQKVIFCILMQIIYMVGQ